ncbi:MAG: sulfatase-like hydrolase/transferase [Verrucomicrobia bacterium]|nr:sulfatase-like hydrolase/transferase [Verrucomicrobiota bacterium]MDA1066477.1 sulfatase-like hydrolase/transferase [Verrucomicrobiota bacterium]
MKSILPLLLFVFAFCFQSHSQDKPNFIIIMVDDMGYAGLSSYGNPHYKTPQIDRLAEEGMKFTDFHSSCPVCSPTRAGLLTGRYQQRTGVEAIVHPYSQHPVHYQGLQREEITFAEALQDAGYATGIIGKWHLGYANEQPKYHPQNHGFDEFIGYHGGNDDFINHIGDHFEHDWWHGKKEVHEEGYVTHLINKYSLDFVERHKDEPFCLYVSHEAMHSPYQGPGDVPQRLHTNDAMIRYPDVGLVQEMSDALDEGVGQLREKLIELNLDKNTLVFFFSDNGGTSRNYSNFPDLRGTKGALWEGGHRVPAFAWWPGSVKAGTETDQLGISIDLMPTMLNLAKATLPQDHLLDGVDISPVFLSESSLPHRPLFWSYIGNGGNRQEAMRDGNWKLVVDHPNAKPGTFENETLYLFDLEKDLGEQNNLAVRFPDRTADMLRQVKVWYRDVTRDATPQPGGWLARNNQVFDERVFNGKDLSGWSSKNPENWSVEEGSIVAGSRSEVPESQYLWSDVEVEDFYLSIDVKQTAFNGNGGVVFRANDDTSYQADLGVSPVEGILWGKLYQSGGPGMIDMNDRGDDIVRAERWNHLEVMAVDDRIWIALNGRICSAVKNLAGPRSGKLGFQLSHGNHKIYYKINQLVHNPEVQLAGYFENELNALLKTPNQL